MTGSMRCTLRAPVRENDIIFLIEDGDSPYFTTEDILTVISVTSDAYYVIKDDGTTRSYKIPADKIGDYIHYPTQVFAINNVIHARNCALLADRRFTTETPLTVVELYLHPEARSRNPANKRTYWVTMPGNPKPFCINPEQVSSYELYKGA